MTYVMEAVPDDVEVEVYAPDGSFWGRIEYISAKVTRQPRGSRKMDLSVDFDAEFLHRSFTKNATTQSMYKWEGSEFLVRVLFRGSEWFMGHIVDMDDEDDSETADNPGDVPITVKMTMWADVQWLLSARLLYGVSGARWAASAEAADDACRELVRANCTVNTAAGYPVEPAWYGSNSVNREDFGSAEIAVASDVSSGSTVTWRWEHGAGLWESLVEFAKVDGLDITGSWNLAASPPVLTIDFPTTTGTDRSSGSGAIRVSRENETLVRFKRKVSRSGTNNVAMTQGKGTRENQARAYSVNTASMADLGPRETGDTVPSAWSNDCQNEADYIIEESGGAAITYEVKIAMIPGMEYGPAGDYDLGDKIVISDSRRDITVTDYVVEDVLTHVAGKPWELVIKTGHMQQNLASQLSRGGGGGRGGKRSGGPPKKKGGEPESARTITTETGNVVFDEQDDELNLHGEIGETRVRNILPCYDPGATEDEAEEILIYVAADYDEPAPTATGYVLIWEPNLAQNIKLLANNNPGGGGTPPTTTGGGGP